MYSHTERVWTFKGEDATPRNLCQLHIHTFTGKLPISDQRGFCHIQKCQENDSVSQ